MKWNARWIAESSDFGDICPEYIRPLTIDGDIKKAVLSITAHGVYEAGIDGEKISDAVLMPGWTSYKTRLQMQTYDVTNLLIRKRKAVFTCVVGHGWYSSPMPGWVNSSEKEKRMAQKRAMTAILTLTYKDGSVKEISTDDTFSVRKSRILFSEIYDGEIYDAAREEAETEPVQVLTFDNSCLIPQEGELIKECERVAALKVFRTPKGETLVDFGQEVTGYAVFTVNARKGEKVEFVCGEMLDKDGNFYNENYRSAKAKYTYICRDGKQTAHARLTYYGFRYIKLLSFPGEAKKEDFTAIAVHSDLRRTGHLISSDPMVNQLFSNIRWGQLGNFLDVPTDCPQRDERLGWTGDAEVFVRTASYQYDVEKFFRKWLHDMKADQRKDGGVGSVIPDLLPEDHPGAAWGDAAVICPWTIYHTYGDPAVLQDQFSSMKAWIDYITHATTTPYLWTGGVQFGDWLGLDAKEGSYRGASRENFIASAYYYYSTGLLIRAGRVLHRDMTAYEELRRNILAAFRKKYPVCTTQTEYVLSIWFGLSENPQKDADALDQMIKDGGFSTCGFVGTPYILHTLTAYGHADTAWSLFLRKDFPSWLYSVSKGATTVWEHWDGCRADGSFWSADMNSFNHYAYGAVADWVYEDAAGIRAAKPGFQEIELHPHPDHRLSSLKASLATRHGLVESGYTFTDQGVRYECTVPVKTTLILPGRQEVLAPGSYTFWM